MSSPLMFPRPDRLEEAKRRIDLPGYIAGRWPESGARAGRADTIRAAWRGDRTPSCSVYQHGGAWFWKDKGVGDGVGGSIVDLLMEADGLSKTAAIAEALRLAGLDDAPPVALAAVRPTVVAAFDYRDERGELLYQAVRREPGDNGKRKDFRQRRPDPDARDGWSWKLGDVRLVLYRLPELLAADPAAPVFIPEGERHVDRLRDLGLVATCNPMGAGKWKAGDPRHAGFAEALRGRHVVLLPDNDSPGKQHATHVAIALGGVAASVRVLELPGLPAKGDVLDWLAAGGDYAQLMAMAAEVKPLGAYAESHPSSPVVRPTITIESGNLTEVLEGVESALTQGPPTVYQRGTEAVRVGRASPATVRGMARRDEALVILPVNEAWLVQHLTAIARFEKFDNRRHQLVERNCPVDVARAYLARAGQWGLPPLVAVAQAPTLRPDGSVIDVPGYDAATGLLYDPAGFDFPPMPATPMRADALAALAQLRDVVSKFPFEEAHDEAIALAAILTAVGRRAMRTAPMFAFNAPKMASGKSLLADVVSLIATGRRASVMTHATKPDDEAKRLLAVLMEGDPVVCIDNISAPLASDALCSILTQETWKDRVLGVSKTATVPTCLTWLATGNNLVIEGDMTTRVLRCDLDPKVERPEEREFDRNLYEWIPTHRGDLVAAGLTILRAFHLAGRPSQGLQQFGRFEEWSGWVRASLVWLGLPDPCLCRGDVEEADTVRTQLRALLTTWHDTFGSEPTTVNDAIARARQPENEDLAAAIGDVAAMRGEFDARRLGRYLSKHAKRIEAGLRFEQAGVLHKVATWRAKPTGGITGVSGVTAMPPAENGSLPNLMNGVKRTPETTLTPTGDHPPQMEGEWL